MEQSFDLAIDHQSKSKLHTNLFPLITACVNKLDMQALSDVSDRIVQDVLRVISSSKDALSHEDAITLTGSLADKIGTSFLRYMDHLKAPLLTGLNNFEEQSVCKASIIAIADILGSLKDQMFPMCNDIVKCMMDLLRSPSADRYLKPPAIGLFGEIARAIGGRFFDYYANIILGLLDQAGSVVITGEEDEDFIDYANSLRLAILEAYVEIIVCANEFGKIISVLFFLHTKLCNNCVNQTNDIRKDRDHGAKSWEFTNIYT